MRAVLFSGQGSQATAMGKDLYAQFPEARAVYNQAALPFDALALSEAQLAQTRYQQPALVLFHLAVWAVLEARGLQVDAVAGLSLGQYSALCAAGSLDPEAALRIIDQRAQYMSEACQVLASTMWALIGANVDDVPDRLRTLEGTQYPVEVANQNCPGQRVISLARVDEARVEAALGDLGLRIVPLDVEGGFHASFMRDAGERLQDDLGRTTFRPAHIPVYLDTTGALWQGEDLRELLARQVYQATNMQAVLEAMLRQGVTEFVEVGHAQTFRGFLRKIDRQVPVHQLHTVDTITSYLAI